MHHFWDFGTMAVKTFAVCDSGNLHKLFRNISLMLYNCCIVPIIFSLGLSPAWWVANIVADVIVLMLAFSLFGTEEGKEAYFFHGSMSTYLFLCCEWDCRWMKDCISESGCANLNTCVYIRMLGLFFFFYFCTKWKDMFFVRIRVCIALVCRNQ